jgi:hypothetical protein
MKNSFHIKIKLILRTGRFLYRIFLSTHIKITLAYVLLHTRNIDVRTWLLIKYFLGI